MQKSYKVALFLETSRHYGRELINGIIRYSRLYGPWSFYRDDQFYMIRTAKKDLSYLKLWGVDGIIARDFKGVISLLDLDVPIITARNLGHLDTHVQIRADDELIGKLAFDHFLKKGFKEFAFCGFSNMPWSTQRQAGFDQSAHQNRFKIHTLNSLSSGRMLRRNDEYMKLAKWLKQLPKPIGLFCCNDDRGYDAIEACHLAKLKVPYDIAVLGVDNDNQICETSNPPLSSICLGVEKAGFEAAACLHKMMMGKNIDFEEIIVNPININERHSTDIMAIEDENVTTALHYIHEHSRELIQAEDVAAAIGISRRSLDKRFEFELGHSVFNEICRYRVETICKLLIETDLTISEIALMLGYNDSDHIARFFKKEKKVTPKQFRNTYGLKKRYGKSS